MKAQKFALFICGIFYSFFAAAAPSFQQKIADVDIYVISAVDSMPPAKNLIAKNKDDQNFIDSEFKKAPKNHQNILVLKHSKFIALVDTGFENTFENVKNELAGLNIKPEDITHLIITHAHFDHIGGAINNGKANYPNAQLYIDEKDYNGWQSDKTAAAVFKAYENKILFFKHNEKLLPSDLHINAIPAYGHTVGHNLIAFKENNQSKLVFWADLMHFYNVQYPRPDIAISFDTDPEKAIQTRQKFLQEFKTNKTPILGAHMPFGEPIVLE